MSEQANCDHCEEPLGYGSEPTLVASREAVAGWPIAVLLCEDCWPLPPNAGATREEVRRKRR